MHVSEEPELPVPSPGQVFNMGQDEKAYAAAAAAAAAAADDTILGLSPEAAMGASVGATVLYGIALDPLLDKSAFGDKAIRIGGTAFHALACYLGWRANLNASVSPMLRVVGGVVGVIAGLGAVGSAIAAFMPSAEVPDMLPKVTRTAILRVLAK